VLGVGLLLAGCASPPAEQAETVREAVRKAEQEEADVYSPEAWERANNAWTAAEEELARQGARVSLFRSYREAGVLLGTALADAEEAYRTAVERRREMTAEVGSTLEDLRGDLDTAEELLSKLAGCRALLNSEALELLAVELEDLRGACGEIEDDLAQDDVFEAWTASRTTSEEVERFLQKADDLAERSGC
jgi:hypothetical protein